MFNYYFYNRKDTKGKFMTEQTLLKYMQESHVLVDQAKVMDCTILEDGRTAFILNQTIFYPQGGGQPYDQGYIKSEDAIFQVNEVRFKDGIVYHIGSIKEGSFDKDSLVDLYVDKDRRL